NERWITNQPACLRVVVLASRLRVCAAARYHQPALPGSNIGSAALGVAIVDLSAQFHFVFRSSALVSEIGVSSTVYHRRVSGLCSANLQASNRSTRRLAHTPFPGLHDLPRRTGALKARGRAADGILPGGFGGLSGGRRFCRDRCAPHIHILF